MIPQVARVNPKATEDQFQSWLLSAARLNGYDMQYHTRYSIGSTPGWPDWVFTHPSGDIFFAELKSGSRKTKPSAEQMKWIERLRVCGLEAHVWWPKDAQYALDRLIAKQRIAPPAPT